MDHRQVLGALVLFGCLVLCAWVACGIYELRHDQDPEPEPPAPKPEPVIWPPRPEWATDGTGRHRKA